MSKESVTLDARRLSWPVDWAAIFGRPALLWMEIGFGNGQFLVELARKHPSVNLLGLEISLPSLRRAQQRLARAEVNNVRLLSCDAVYALWALCAADALDAVFINFPDPWPKAAHHHRRLIDDRFLSLLATRTKPSARLDIATDHEEYAHVVSECLQRGSFFESRGPAVYVTNDPQRTRTKYEQTALDAGRTCRYFSWRRNNRPAVDSFPFPMELPMPHIVLTSPMKPEEIAKQFSVVVWAGEGARGRFLDILSSARGEVFLVDTYIIEEPISQRVALTLRLRRGRPNEFILGLHELGFPRPTRGVHIALAALANWLKTLQPNTEIVEGNLSPSLLLSDVTIESK